MAIHISGHKKRKQDRQDRLRRQDRQENLFTFRNIPIFNIMKFCMLRIQSFFYPADEVDPAHPVIFCYSSKICLVNVFATIYLQVPIIR